ncbi:MULTISPECIES: restriction endonuclease fold toxin 5 domain-containing protein [Burkholderia cepacia complex]|uniref:Restriction endonuclease fold toxin 5 domain-containing protein n=2 Tax=Burkholderia cepacia complex TaxID=87882 RepID=A0ABZ3BRM0_BURPY|nr:restriction endonuclease fold toxin 5 domain-containing protein [Burkholderia stabilis]BAX61299.1 hypothetical protein BSFP_041660 [Burkholderia stabilis]
MAAPLIPLAAAAATEIGPVLSAIGGALLGGATVAGVASMSGSTAQTKEDAKTESRTVSDSTKPCKKCPPENTGRKVRNNHGVNWPAYQYQARVTGFAYDTEGCHWSEEWEWLGVDFDGFKPEECLLQEAKGNYDQFLDGSIPGADEFFKGFPKMMKTVVTRAVLVKANPPTRLRYYFQGRLTYQKMAPGLKKLKVESEYLP